MTSTWLRRFVPPPKYLTFPAAGLDLSDRSLKFLSFKETAHGLALDAFGARTLPLDIVQAGEIKNKAALIEILKKIRDEWRLENVIVALPEEKAYIVRINLPKIAPAEERESIELQLEEHVPLPPAEVIFDYEPVAGARHGQTMVVSVLPRRLVADYEETLTAAGLRPLAFEIEAQAVARALVSPLEAATTLIVDFGKTRTSFFVVRRGQVLFTSTSAALGGDVITRTIQKNTGLSEAEAEKMKLEQGLLVPPAAGPGSDILPALVPMLSVLGDEINKLREFWQEHLKNSGTGEGELGRVLLCGGEAVLPGLTDYFSDQLDLPVELGNVWTNALDLERQVPALPFRHSLRYATTIGLALRSCHND